MNKRLFFVLISACLWSIAVAQTNLREGSVFTLEGDTLHGSIEYRTDKINEKRCKFIEDGARDYKIYSPGEIKGYRFLDNGRYYISMSVKRVDQYGKEYDDLCFVEYVMRGKMSLYQVSSDNLFIVETDDGKKATFHSLDAIAASDHKASREDKAEVAVIVQPSYTASTLLQSANNLNQTKEVVKAYNDETCPNGLCEVFEYPAKQTPRADRNVHWVIKSGVQFTHLEILNPSYYWTELRYKYPTIVSPTIEFALDTHLDRLLQGLMIQASVGVSPLSFEDGDCNFKAIQTDFKVGAAYQFKLKRIKPYIRAGFRLDNYLNLRYSCPKIHVENVEADRALEVVPSGLYFGGGVEVPLKKGALVVDCTLNRKEFNPLNIEYTLSMDRMACMVGYKF